MEPLFLSSAIGMASPALPRLSPSDARTCSALLRSHIHALTEQAMGAMQDKGGMGGMSGMHDNKPGGGMGNMEMK